jgi:hypothetical protein
MRSRNDLRLIDALCRSKVGQVVELEQAGLPQLLPTTEAYTGRLRPIRYSNFRSPATSSYGAK